MPDSEEPDAPRNHGTYWFQWLLWNSRYVIIVAVVASMVVALAVFVLAAADVFTLFGYLHEYLTDFDGTHAEHARAHVLTSIVGFLDAVLFAAILFIFALGLYELFIGRIEPAEGSKFAERLLLIRSIDDLKDRLAKVIFLILIVKYFELAITWKVTTSLDLLYFALGIALISVGLFLTKPKDPKSVSTLKGDV
jgi:uncharacterized membrane protein YqhA